eukprot:g22441.t1
MYSGNQEYRRRTAAFSTGPGTVTRARDPNGSSVSFTISVLYRHDLGKYLSYRKDGYRARTAVIFFEMMSSASFRTVTFIYTIHDCMGGYSTLTAPLLPVSPNPMGNAAMVLSNNLF